MLVAYLSISAVCLFFFRLQRFLQRAGAHDVCWCWCMLQRPSNLKDNKTQTDIGGANGRQVFCIFLKKKELKNPTILKISSKSQASKGWKNRYIENKHNLAILRAIGTFWDDEWFHVTLSHKRSWKVTSNYIDDKVRSRFEVDSFLQLEIFQLQKLLSFRNKRSRMSALKRSWIRSSNRSWLDVSGS